MNGAGDELLAGAVLAEDEHGDVAGGDLPGRLHDALHRLRLADHSFEAAGQVDGIVESARPLDAAALAHLSTSLAVHFKKKLNLENKIVPELVGGARVIAGNRMIDYTVQGRLEALRRKLLDVPISASRS
jgi:hypothetical protein